MNTDKIHQAHTSNYTKCFHILQILFLKNILHTEYIPLKKCLLPHKIAGPNPLPYIPGHQDINVYGYPERNNLFVQVRPGPDMCDE